MDKWTMLMSERAVVPPCTFPSLFTHQASPQIPGGHIGVLGVLGRYQTDDMALSGQVSNSGSLHASFYQKCSENLQIGVEMETNFKMQACRGISRTTSI